jgi:hypothetical protein
VIVIVILVLLMLTGVENASQGTFLNPTTAYSTAFGALARAHASSLTTSPTSLTPTQFVRDFVVPFGSDYPLTINYTLNSAFNWTNPAFDAAKLKQLRYADVLVISGSNFKAAVSIEAFMRSNAGSNLLVVLLMTVVLAFGNLIFILKADSLIINPVERMIAIVRKLSRDPFQVDHTMEMNEAVIGKTALAEIKRDEGSTVVLMVRKLIDLLRMGLGPGGAELVTVNLSRAQRGIVLNEQGSHQEAVFASGLILRFDEHAAILKEDILILANAVAQQVLGVADKCSGGTALRLDGKSFLLSWQNPDVPFDALSALTSCVHAIKGTLTSKTCERLSQLGPVRIAFGFSTGTAVSGVVGTLLRVQPTYLGSPVSEADTLASLTGRYGVPLLMTGAFVDMLPPTWRPRPRHVDTLLLPGIKEPVRIFVFDDLDNVHPVAGFLTDNKHNLTTPPPPSKWVSPQTRNRELFDEGFLAYTQGRWRTAAAKLEDFVDRTGDQPSKLLLQFMESKGGVAPLMFNGQRHLEQ